MYQRTLVLILSAVLLAGCTQTEDGPKTVKAMGIVTLDGTPVVEAQVVFVDVKGVPAYASTNASGKFSLMISDKKMGAVPGTYTVSVSKTKMESVGEGSVKLEHGLPQHYGDSTKSGLSITIPDTGTDSIKLELVSAKKK